MNFNLEDIKKELNGLGYNRNTGGNDDYYKREQENMRQWQEKMQRIYSMYKRGEHVELNKHFISDVTREFLSLANVTIEDRMYCEKFISEMMKGEVVEQNKGSIESYVEGNTTQERKHNNKKGK